MAVGFLLLLFDAYLSHGIFSLGLPFFLYAVVLASERMSTFGLGTSCIYSTA